MCVCASVRATGLQAEPDKKMRDLWAAEQLEAERQAEQRRGKLHELEPPDSKEQVYSLPACSFEKLG